MGVRAPLTIAMSVVFDIIGSKEGVANALVNPRVYQPPKLGGKLSGRCVGEYVARLRRSPCSYRLGDNLACPLSDEES